MPALAGVDQVELDEDFQTLGRTDRFRSGSSMVVGMSVVSGHGANHPWRVDLIGDSAWSADLKASRFWAGLEPFLAPEARDELYRRAFNLPTPTVTDTPRPTRTRTATAKPTPEGGHRVRLPWVGRFR
jgi:hypothetical protein